MLEECKLRRKNKDLPRTSDLIRLNDYDETAMSEEVCELMDCPSVARWWDLANTIFVLLTIFNKCKGGEVSKIRLISFEERESRLIKIQTCLRCSGNGNSRFFFNIIRPANVKYYT